ncbi:hypothetical protein BKA70DRAFT_1216018 [Coprinopsis sp. MPI-PUGE-AT-0042]|nr:hypothetical protein BKA70DRAFT_1216018 [Coprinopsis sp. MPI-PUGE-AT-0042]
MASHYPGVTAFSNVKRMRLKGTNINVAGRDVNRELDTTHHHPGNVHNNFPWAGFVSNGTNHADGGWVGEVSIGPRSYTQVPTQSSPPLGAEKTPAPQASGNQHFKAHPMPIPQTAPVSVSSPLKTARQSARQEPSVDPSSAEEVPLEEALVGGNPFNFFTLLPSPSFLIPETGLICLLENSAF